MMSAPNVSSTESSAARPATTSNSAGVDDDGKAISRNIVAKAKRNKLCRFQTLLDQPNIDLVALRKIGWNGIPAETRPATWKLLLGYMPANKSRRDQVLKNRRANYSSYVEDYYSIPEQDRSDSDVTILHQIRVDVPRTSPGSHIFSVHSGAQISLERMLYVWAIRHPASGYVQGINDIAAAFYVLFMCDTLPNFDMNNFTSLSGQHLDTISAADYTNVEADTFWCLSKLVDGIQDYFTFAQPGIQRALFQLQELVHRIDQPLWQHLEDEHVIFMQFGLRWMNCLLIRELPLPVIVRAWDTYLSQPSGAGFKDFHVYVCAAMLCSFSQQIRDLDSDHLLMFLQALPTSEWTERDIESTLAQAYVYQSLFQAAPSHLQ
jgi:TBC1 domain family member 2